MYEWIGKITANSRFMGILSRICGWIPRPLILLACRSMGLLLLLLAGRSQRDNLLNNMRDLLPGRSDKERRSIRRRYFQNIVFTLYELMLEADRLQTGVERPFRIRGEDHLEQALRIGHGAIVYTPHAGNFFYYYWYLCRNYRCLTIATAGSPELRPLYLRFQAMGCPGLDYDNTPPLELLRKLRSHLAGNGVVFILGDFWRPTFPESRFFGKRTRSPEGAAKLAIELRVPIIPFYGRRTRGFEHELNFEQPLHLYAGFTKQQRGEATLVLNRFMERVIRQHPEQWFYWFNAEQRWEPEPEAHLKAGRERKRAERPVKNKKSVASHESGPAAAKERAASPETVAEAAETEMKRDRNAI
ncbi:lysophospholipid acyltransferase family protein [Paenibacillus piri]|uniref:Lipid A biosynthesis acyltransferase n=1 Tax=Paenibacillus piri TaxID=2547395 RepID=A0A4R5KV09_9BACL|nr:lysophospholipid acyltransferase family protein [Paenibacillus piri]TDF99576.1 lipid A biosynthesis acyltransferase [Paenibacillus piri]